MGDILYNLKLAKQGTPYNATIGEFIITEDYKKIINETDKRIDDYNRVQAHYVIKSQYFIAR